MSTGTQKNNDLTYSPKNIRERITELRRKKKMTIYALGLNSGLNNTIILRIENGEREPKIGTLLKIIDGLEISPSEFFTPFAKY